MSKRKRALSGIRATGNPHLGNLLGMIKPALSLQSEYECQYFIADLHSLTTNKDPKDLQEKTLDLVATFLAFGFDTKAHFLYRQSDVPCVTELAWYLSCCTGMGFLEKAHAYKDASGDGREVNHGVFAYPVLMAADIVLYDADLVPVGKDQKQHLEMSRDMAGSLNALYGEGVLKLPEALIREDVMTIPGLDGRKMSKSYGNEIPIFCDAKTLRKKVLSIKTDSTPMEEPKSIEGNLIGDLYVHFGSRAQFADLESRMQAGGLGWGHAKDELFQVIDAYLAEPRSNYERIRRDVPLLKATLEDGAARAAALARPVLDRVRKAMGFTFV